MVSLLSQSRLYLTRIALFMRWVGVGGGLPPGHGRSLPTGHLQQPPTQPSPPRLLALDVVRATILIVAPPLTPTPMLTRFDLPALGAGSAIDRESAGGDARLPATLPKVNGEEYFPKKVSGLVMGDGERVRPDVHTLTPPSPPPHPSRPASPVSRCC